MNQVSFSVLRLNAMMKIEQSVALPVIVLLFAAQCYFVESRYVKLIDQLNEPIDIGNVIADETTVGELKQIIATQLKVSLDSIRLIRETGIPYLDDGRFLADYLDINEDAIVKLCNDLTKPGKIHIGTSTNTFHVIATKHRTLGWLKNEALLGLDNSEAYEVYFGGKVLFDESKTLGQYNLYDGAMISLFRDHDRFQVTLYLSENEKKSLFATPETTVGDLTQMIEREGIDISNKLLFHDKERLCTDRKLVSYMRIINSGISIKMVELLGDLGGNLEMLYLKKDFLQHFPVFVLANNTVSDLKRYSFSVERSIPVNQMKLKFGRKVLNDDTSKLSEFNLYPGARIQVCRR